MDDQEDVSLLPPSPPNPLPDQTYLVNHRPSAMQETTHEPTTSFPFPTFTLSRPDARKRRTPQCIAHRGYKAAHPENTMSAFRGAVAIGAQAIETDLHLTKDDVVVISHDPSLKRCFGIDATIADLTWEQVSKARTLQEPHEPMPRLFDLLAFLAQPANARIWLLLDIKIDNPPAKLMSLIASTIASVPLPLSSDSPPWTSRILLGIWAAKYLPLALKHLPGFPVTHIGFALSYARHFFEVPNVGFNMFLPMLIAPGGKKFIREAKGEHEGGARPVLAWTVNERSGMEWCLRQGLDGVITDDPARFLGVCDEWSRRLETGQEGFGEGGLLPVGFREYWRCLRVWVWVQVLVWLPGTRKRLLPVASRALVDSIMGYDEGKEA